MDVSIVIPTFNRRHLIKYTLDSIVGRAGLTDLPEVIVVDDGSTDGTSAFVTETYRDVSFMRNEGKGANAARNTGLRAASKSYVIYLDSDDLIEQDFYRDKVTLLNTHPDFHACYGGYDYFDSDAAFETKDIVFKHKYPLISDNDNEQHLVNYLGGTFLPQCSVMWRRSFLLRIGGHDESLAINQDVELFLRAIFNGLSIACSDNESRVLIRQHNSDVRVGSIGNNSQVQAAKLRSVLDLRKKIFQDLRTYGRDSERGRSAMSTYLFNLWRHYRHQNPDISAEILQFAKQVYWPVSLGGGQAFKALSSVFGPERAVKVKYFFLKRD